MGLCRHSSNKLKSKKDCDRLKVESLVSEFFHQAKQNPLTLEIPLLLPSPPVPCFLPCFIALFMFVSKWLHLAVASCAYACSHMGSVLIPLD